MNTPSFSLVDLLFYFVAAVTLVSGAYAVFSRNITRAVFSLLATFFSVAVLYGLLAADFVAVIQIMVYVGGILVLLLFAVMLTGNIEKIPKSNRATGLALGILTGLALAGILGSVALNAPWATTALKPYIPSTGLIGSRLLKEALLPFEVLSVVLLGVVIGAVVIVRGRSDVSEKQDSP